ncbi:MAG: hypothetical protein KA143_02115 [Saprospiraceae bacterium]|jgi:hypothetical protein|nr:hypothetical protein [Saprospiraceae bacterium]
MLNKKLNKKQKNGFRLMASVILTGIFYYLISEFIPVHEGQPKPSILKNLFYASVFGFLPFYIMPWLNWIMGHENDFEENMDGDPKAK